MKTAFIFAGQGSQYVGMGKSLYDHYPQARDVFDHIQLDFDVKEVCFNGPLEQLSKTQYTQPCMAAVAVSLVRILKDHGITPDMVAGLSLGEYSALYTAGVFDEATLFDLLRFRGIAMTQTSAGIEAQMMAILGLDRETLADCCQAARELGYVQICNYNCPGQLVIGGEKPAVQKASELALAHHAKRALPLKTSGPFHTQLLNAASQALKEKCQTVTFHDMQIPVIFNTTAAPLQPGTTIAQMLEKQVSSPVYFEDSIRYMISQGVDTFIEVGPGKVLSGFVKKIDRSLTCYAVEDQASLIKTITLLKGENHESK